MIDDDGNEATCYYCWGTEHLGRYGMRPQGAWVCDECVDQKRDRLKKEGVQLAGDAAVIEVLDEVDPEHRRRPPIATYQIPPSRF